MKLQRLALALLLAFGLTAGMAAPAAADAATEEFWYYAYAVDKYVVVNPKDNLGLYMRYGAGAEYEKVHDQTIPMHTTLHIIQETTDSRGLKWGYTVYDFPNTEWEEEGWVCLVETYEVDPTAPAQPEPQPQAPAEEPAQEPQVVPPAPPQPETPTEEEPFQEPATDEAPAEQPAQSSGSVTTSLMLVGIGIVIGVVVLTALLLLLRKKK